MSMLRGESQSRVVYIRVVYSSFRENAAKCRLALLSRDHLSTVFDQ